MTELPNTYTANRKVFKLVKRQGDACMFRSGNEYEVFQVAKNKTRTFPDGNVKEAWESVPGNERWGKEAWTAIGLESAEKRFRALVELLTVETSHHNAISCTDPTTEYASQHSA